MTQKPDIEIIAELAQGFEGNKTQALLMLKAAKSAGADAAKFQLVYADELGTPDYKYYELFKGLEMPDSDWQAISETANKLGIDLCFDIFGQISLKLAEKLGIKSVKLHGTDISNIGFLKDIAASSIHRILLGAGGAYLSEIERALEILQSKQVIVFLGFQAYPTPNETNHIARVKTLVERWKDKQNITVGFADHADPESPAATALACAALGAGATIFEKHLTLGRNMQLEDHESALNPDEFAGFVKALHVSAAAMGRESNADDFDMSEAEQSYRRMIRRHVVTARAIPAGTTLKPEDLVLKRSGIEDFITDLDSAYGKVTTRDLAANEPVKKSDIQG